ncbi:histidine--tRNA ligase [Sphingobacteriales bacterium UPWRP_1]|nr:histidine--tRNA ligase [Sphingobacteriales bacterium TSM_CSM]PSJ76140.1 histidine--tRNA ligase [Sphingobacteriales bacterium UPWRP_1]
MKPSIPSGTRDFSPAEVRKRQYITGLIRQNFEQFGYEPLETPAMENLDTLMGKYGDEGDKLIFKILNNGLDLPEKRAKTLAGFEQVLSGKNTKDITERALRYDLTIPFARYVVMNQGKLPLPFKRYQIQPVWRADRPQKGRYREFYQCDADAIGTTSLLNEAELVQIYDRVYAQLGMKVRIAVNNRKILAGIAEVCGMTDKFTDLTVAIDKLDKIGPDGVSAELSAKGINQQALQTIQAFLQLTGSNAQILANLKAQLATSATGQKGIAELETLFTYLAAVQLQNAVQIDITLARGLNYYTGCIFEVKTDEVKIGSLGGGGRYDDLTGTFGLKGLSGVGISFGLDRIYDVLEELNLFPKEANTVVRALFINFGNEFEQYAFTALQQLRAKGIPAEMYPDAAKLKKQMDYANARQIPFVVFCGETELQTGRLTLKNMLTGQQQEITSEELIMVVE